MTAAPQLAEELFNEHHRRIYSYCLRQLGSREEAEDAVQATYLNACRSLNDGFEPHVAQAWLFAVAHNVCLTRRRSSYRRARHERPQDLQAVQDTVAAPEPAGDELFGLDDALAGLPEQQRQAILLREWQGLSYREVAAKLEISQAAVETLIFRARRSLASGLEQPLKRRRRLVHSLDAGALFASVKTALAGNLAASVATGVAVAASVATLSTGVVPRALDFPSHAQTVVAKADVKKAPAPPRARLSDRDAPPVTTVAPSSAPKADPKGWAGDHPRAVGKGKAKKPGHGKPAHSPSTSKRPDSPPGAAQSASHAPSAPPAHGQGGKKG